MNDEELKNEPKSRRSRFEWLPGDITIIKSADQPEGKKEKRLTPASPQSPNPAGGEPKKDNGRKDG